MGSLISRPKIPAPPKIVIRESAGQKVTSQTQMQQSSADITENTEQNKTGENKTGENKTDENKTDQDQSAARAENLLRRNRGRTGTVLTGFTGLLAPENAEPRRKTLLGE